MGELLVILLCYVQGFLYCSERRDEKYGMKNGTREWKEGDKMNKHINYWGKEKGNERYHLVLRKWLVG